MSKTTQTQAHCDTCGGKRTHNRWVAPKDFMTDGLNIGMYIAVERDRENNMFTLLEGAYPVRNRDRIVGICPQPELLRLVQDDAGRCGYECATLHVHYPHSCILRDTHHLTIPGHTITIVDRHSRKVFEQGVPSDKALLVADIIKLILSGLRNGD